MIDKLRNEAESLAIRLSIDPNKWDFARDTKGSRFPIYEGMDLLTAIVDRIEALEAKGTIND